jgi:hypothetical protein
MRPLQSTEPGAPDSPLLASVPQVGAVLLRGMEVYGAPDGLENGGKGVLRWVVNARVQILSGKRIKYSYKVDGNERQNGEADKDGFINITATLHIDTENGASQPQIQPNLSRYTKSGVLSFDINSKDSVDLKFEIGTYSQGTMKVPDTDYPTANTNTPFLRPLESAPFQFQPIPGRFGVYGRP